MVRSLGADERLGCIRGACGERGEQVAQRLAFIRVPAVEMDELAELVDVLDRVLQ